LGAVQHSLCIRTVRFLRVIRPCSLPSFPTIGYPLKLCWVRPVTINCTEATMGKVKGSGVISYSAVNFALHTGTSSMRKGMFLKRTEPT